MTKVYIVIDSGGNYEDSWDYIEKAFFDKEVAEKYMEDKNKWLEIQKQIEESKLHKEFSDEEYENMTDEEYKNCTVDYELLYEKNNYFIRIITLYSICKKYRIHAKKKVICILNYF
jgi:hypothetical protein